MAEQLTEQESAAIAETYRRIKDEINRLVVGNDDLIRLLMLGLLTQGHVLIEGVPGTAKTTLVKAMSLLLECDFTRVQCAVDTQPADIIGVRIWDQATHEFVLKRGPIFTNVILIDEINRLPPKSQSAFIEAMSELQATIDGVTYPLGSPFVAIATQNPFELEGTFPLIEAQKDRFMFSIRSRHLDAEDELEVIRREYGGILDWHAFEATLRPMMQREQLNSFVSSVRRVYLDEDITTYIRDIVMATRTHGDLRLGSSSRGSIAIVRGSMALAALEGRTYVIPDDVKEIVGLTLPHRIILQQEAELAGVTARQIISDILETIEVP